MNNRLAKEFMFKMLLVGYIILICGSLMGIEKILLLLVFIELLFNTVLWVIIELLFITGRIK